MFHRRRHPRRDVVVETRHHPRRHPVGRPIRRERVVVVENKRRPVEKVVIVEKPPRRQVEKKIVVVEKPKPVETVVVVEQKPKSELEVVEDQIMGMFSKPKPVEEKKIIVEKKVIVEQAPQPKLMSAVVPQGIFSGQTFNLILKNGQMVSLVVPPGSGPGSIIQFYPPAGVN
mmetsp:Transcript_2070/g.2969  ORF Transcript_2070/g.2969 Transcript_2070/m.2969 type:complete len:172 (+) Transcript_2070:117-632(+)